MKTLTALLASACLVSFAATAQTVPTARKLQPKTQAPQEPKQQISQAGLAVTIATFVAVEEICGARFNLYTDRLRADGATLISALVPSEGAKKEYEETFAMHKTIVSKAGAEIWCTYWSAVPAFEKYFKGV